MFGGRVLSRLGWRSGVVLMAGAPILDDEKVTLSNWSATHTIPPTRIVYPESVQEAEELFVGGDAALRPVGSIISPNGLALTSDATHVSLALCDKIVEVNDKDGTVRVEAGIEVGKLERELGKVGRTLENFASISSQQIGGFTQAGAHGTGARIPPVDEQVVGLRLATPAGVCLELSRTSPPSPGPVPNAAGAEGDGGGGGVVVCVGGEDGQGEGVLDGDGGVLFDIVKLGLGWFGLVTEVTLRTVPAHRLEEVTEVMSRAEVRNGHAERLQTNRHVRYMWLPYTDDVVVVTSNPTSSSVSTTTQKPTPSPVAMRRLVDAIGVEGAESMSFSQCRDAVLHMAPNDPALVRTLNHAEAEYWRSLSGNVRVDWSPKILGFECGGQQWVSEVCLPAGTIDQPTLQDIDYVTSLLSLIEEEGIPAPCPIEQRWTAPSSSPLSPAYSTNPSALYSWVGIVMYLDPQSDEHRAQVTSTFRSYEKLSREKLWDTYDAVPHWAKVEVQTTASDRSTPGDPCSVKESFLSTPGEARARLYRRMGPSNLALIRQAKQRLDPHNLLRSKLVDTLLQEEE